VKRHKGDYDGAIDDYTKAIELNPKEAQHYRYRGEARLGKGDLDGALADFTQAAKLKPSNTPAGAETQQP